MSGRACRIRGVFLALLTCGVGAQTLVDLRTQSKNVDFSNAATTKPSKTGSMLPASCSPGETYFKTDAPAGKNLYGCTAPNLWTLQASGSDLPAMAGNAGKLLGTDGAAPQWKQLGGDVAGAPESLIVAGIQGYRVANSAPQDGQIMKWNAGQAQWEPASARANYSGSFTNQSTVLIAGSAHGLGSANLIVGCYDNSAPAKEIEADIIRVDASTYDVTIGFASPQSGRCVVSGGGTGGGGGGGGGVSSVFGRSGAVTAQEGDYSLQQLADVAAKQGNSSTVQMFGGGSPAANDCAKFDANGNLISAGAPCGAGGGGATTLSAGTGIIIIGAAPQYTVAVDAAVIPLFLTASTSMDFGAIAPQSCATQSLAMPGAQLGDAVAGGWPATLEGGLVGMMRVSAANTIQIQLCNISASTINPAPADFRATITRSM